MTDKSATGREPDADTLISFQGVCKWFGHFQALQDINLSIKASVLLSAVHLDLANRR